MHDVGIVVVAVNIADEVVARFNHDLRESFDRRSATSYDLKMMSDEAYIEDGLLNKSRALNDGVRSLLESYKVIVCTDIDMLIPPDLIDHTVMAVKNGVNIWTVCRNISEYDIEPRRWEHWLELPTRRSGFGSWNAMLAEDWIRSGGWDQRLTGWGGEDDVFKKRREQKGIHTEICTSFSLMHVNHESRQNKSEMRKGNQEALVTGMSGEDRNWLT